MKKLTVILIIGISSLIVVLSVLVFKETDSNPDIPSKINVPEETSKTDDSKNNPSSLIADLPEKVTALQNEVSENGVLKKEGNKASWIPDITDSEISAKAVQNWELLIDKLIDEKEAPSVERMLNVKEVFSWLENGQKMNEIHMALNLLPDEQFPSLYGILFDKKENVDVLDAIFSDALNRPEEVKLPLLKELRKDKQHPMFFESARILDVIEIPDDEK